MSNTVLDLQTVEYLLAEKERLLRHLDWIKTKGTIEFLAPGMGDEYRQSILREMSITQSAIEAINTTLPCVAFLQKFGSQVYQHVASYFPGITYKTTLERAYENRSSFHWQPPIGLARLDWLPPLSVNMDIPTPIEINLVKFSDGNEFYAFYHLRDYDVLFYRESSTSDR